MPCWALSSYTFRSTPLQSSSFCFFPSFTKQQAHKAFSVTTRRYTTLTDTFWGEMSTSKHNDYVKCIGQDCRRVCNCQLIRAASFRIYGYVYVTLPYKMLHTYFITYHHRAERTYLKICLNTVCFSENVHILVKHQKFTVVLALLTEGNQKLQQCGQLPLTG